MEKPASETRPETRQPAAWSAWRWPAALVSVVAILAFSTLFFYRETLKRVDAAGGAVDDLARQAAEMVENAAANFLTGNITETFISSIPQSQSVAHLELATAEIVETFTRTDERRILGDLVSLGTIESEIRVPVTYRYHLRLDDPWEVEITGDVCIVHAPKIRASTPPAIHTERLTKRVEADWLRFDTDEQMALLEQSLTPTLNRFAQDALHMRLVREDARRSVESFVRNWLLGQGGSADHVRFVKVIFPDETAAGHTGRPQLPVTRQLILE